MCKGIDWVNMSEKEACSYNALSWLHVELLKGIPTNRLFLNLLMNAPLKHITVSLYKV